MTDTAKPLENSDDARIFASPVARAFVRTMVACRGVTESQARQIYLDYINQTQPGRERRPCPAA
jgi:hypothetical protein